MLVGMWRYVVGLGLVLWRAQAGHAQPVLHEYVPDLQPNEAEIAVAELTGAGTIEHEGEVLTAPSGEGVLETPPLSATPGDGLRGEDPGQRSITFRPDRQTSLEAQLDYYEAFTPAIAPFKRVTALDGVTLDRDGLTPLLVVSDPRKQAVPVESPDREPRDGRARDRFFGDVLLDFRAGRDVPLPSVSPESRILHVKTVPEVPLRIERDGADNFFARIEGSLPVDLVRVTFLTDAPRSYFAADLPALPRRVLAAGARPVPPSVAARARAFASEIGIDDADDLRSVLHTLTRYFREWTESDTPPRDTGDIYLDLVRGKKGVCRHRAYGFVVTALALGIPARFVQNEAHSWVEVKVPTLGYLRIDLGGAANGMTAHGASDRPAYVPGEPDRLPQPESYQRSYSTLQQGVTGLRPQADALLGRWVAPTQGPIDDGAPPAFVVASNASQAADGHARKPVTLTLKDRVATVLRGGTLSVSGRLTDAQGSGLSGLRVEVSIAARTRKERMLLGVTVSDEDGYFRAALGVPPGLDVGDYQLVVLTPGDAEYLPVVAE
jgi:transglutaminase-like putative cysteine protease